MKASRSAQSSASRRIIVGKWRAWFEHLPVAAWVERRGRLIHANKMCLSLFGASSLAELDSVWDRVRPHSRETAPQTTRVEATPSARSTAFAPSRLGRKPSNLIALTTRLPGTHRVVLGVVYQRNPGAHTARQLQKERAARVRAEGELRDQALWANLGTLVARVAHDIRNPLFGMLATVDALEAKIGDRNYRDYFAVLRAEAERLNRFVEELLAYGREGKTASRFPIGFKSVVKEAVRRCQPLAEKRHVSLRTVECAEDCLVEGTEERLVQAVQNVVQNAVEHSPGDGEVGVFVRKLRRPKPRMAVCEVCDSGPGFSREDLRHIFEPFYTRRAGGTGLGLSIAARIVGDHGGKIEAGNRREGGAWVRILLPLVAAEKKARPQCDSSRFSR